MIVGNSWVNTLSGGSGNDQLFGDGLVYDGTVGFTSVDANDANDPNRSIPGITHDNDVFRAGTGADTVYGGYGDDTFIATLGANGLEGDIYDGGGYVGGKDLLGLNPRLSLTLDGHDTVDYSALNQNFGLLVDLVDPLNGRAVRWDGVNGLTSGLSDTLIWSSKALLFGTLRKLKSDMSRF